jgi:hypothetical protein
LIGTLVPFQDGGVYALKLALMLLDHEAEEMLEAIEVGPLAHA